MAAAPGAPSAEITHPRWARWHPAQRAARPAHKSACICGAICPANGKGAGLVLPRCNSADLQPHLDEIATAVDPGAHAVLMLDRVG